MLFEDKYAPQSALRAGSSPQELALTQSDEEARAHILSLLEWTGSLATLLEDPTPKYDQLEHVSGLRILERRDLYQDDRDSRYCAQHAFEALGQQVPVGVIGGDTLEALREAGYTLSTTPTEPGGIVYGDYRREVFTGVHVGIVRGDKIESKFSYGHVIEHDVNRIYPRWGTHAIYFHKADKNE